MVEKNEPFPFVIIHLEDATDDALHEELARRWGVDAHKLKNRLTAVYCGLQLEAVRRPDPLEPVAVKGGSYE